MTEETAPAEAETDFEQEAHRIVGKVLSDRYRVDAVLGVGGMGAVFRGEHLLLQKQVAIKVLHPEMTRLPEAVQRFKREAQASSKIDHPNVALAYDFGTLENGAFFLVLEFVEGKNLRELLIAEEVLSPERAVHITRQILHALVRAHSLGIVHRDLKPENIMLVERDGDPDFVKVLDFGIAKVSSSSAAPAPGQSKTAALTQLGMVYGTPEYMAPEQALGQEVDARADLYSTGVMFFEMLCGQRPFDAPSAVQILGLVVSQPVPPLAQFRPDRPVPPAIEEVVRKLLAKVATDRFPDARAAIAALNDVSPPASLGLSGMVPSASMAGVRPASTTLVAAAPPGGAPAAFQQALGRARAGLDQLSRPQKIGGAVAAGVLLLVVLIASFSGSKPTPDGALASASASASEAPPAPPPPAVTDEDIKAAAAQGVTALETLREKAPKNPQLLRALGKAQADAKQGTAALKTLGELIEIDEAAALDPQVRAVVVSLAASEANADPVFAFITDQMGAGGPDVLYDLQAMPKAPPKVQKKARDLLARKEIAAKASPALKVLLGLRTLPGNNASQCARAKGLVIDAKESGDSRALPFLGMLQNTRGCGNFLIKSDCYACLRGDSSLSDAVKAIQAREKGDK